VESQCVPVAGLTCFNVSSPHASTSFSLTGLANRHATRWALDRWRVFQTAPKCWQRLQPLLCSLYLPKCTELKEVILPSRKLCFQARQMCKDVSQHVDGWPELLDCNKGHFAESECRGFKSKPATNEPASWTLLQRNFSEGTCVEPLVPTGEVTSYFNAFNGCGLKCRDPSFSDKDREDTSRLMLAISIFCLGASLTSIVTFLRAGLQEVKYPVFWMQVSCLLVSAGMAMQAIVPADAITCQEDGTRRVDAPLFGWCWINFALIYEGATSFLVWLVVLTYSWYWEVWLEGGRINQHNFTHHLMAWVPGAVVALAINNVEAHSVLNVCFISHNSTSWHLALVTLPTMAALLVANLLFCAFFYKSCKCYKAASSRYEKTKEKDKVAHGGQQEQLKRMKQSLGSALIWRTLYMASVNVAFIYMIIYNILGMQLAKR